MVIVKASAFLLPFLFCSVDLWSSKKKQFTLYSNAFPYYSFISAVSLGGKTNLDYKEKAAGQKTESPICFAYKSQHFRKSFVNSGSQSLKAELHNAQDNHMPYFMRREHNVIVSSFQLCVDFCSSFVELNVFIKSHWASPDARFHSYQCPSRSVSSFVLSPILLNTTLVNFPFLASSMLSPDPLGHSPIFFSPSWIWTHKYYITCNYHIQNITHYGSFPPSFLCPKV